MIVNIEQLKEPTDIVDLLLECHERIRTFAGLACRLATTKELSHDEIRDSAARVSRYFSEALPFHVADEELSIVPRLAGKRPELDAALQEMQREHLAHEAHLHVLVDACNVLKASPAMLGDLHDNLSNAASTLETEFATHLKQEEEIIFPAIRSLLTAEERATMLAELRGRRNS